MSPRLPLYNKKEQPKSPKRKFGESAPGGKNFLSHATAALLLLFLGILLFGNSPWWNPEKELTLGEFFQRYLPAGQVKTIVQQEGELTGKLAEKDAAGQPLRYRVKLPDGYLTPQRIDRMIKVVGEKNYEFRRENALLYHFLISFLPWLLILVFFWFIFFRQFRAPGGSGGVLSFGRSRARLSPKGTVKVTFQDVAGIDEAKEEVEEIIEFLKNPGKFSKLGARIPRGVLLVGPPGTGKTLLAKAISGEANVPFFSISGSDFVEMFVGVGASRVRDLFRQAKESSPCIIFLDEIDAVGRRRGSGLGGGHDEREQTLNAILVEMDGFETDDGIIMMAATNRPDVLDPALLRPGRFDREIVIDLPDLKAREEILRVHARKVTMDPATDLHRMARGTPTFSGADLEAIINEAALLAVLREKPAVTQEELEEARDKVKWGKQKRSRVMDDNDRRITAIHESGHALASCLLPEVDPLHKVTIIPRGTALGATMQLPEKDRYHLQRRTVLGEIKVLYAGRLAEELLCQDISSGAASDIKRATELARLMVCEWGMSPAIGPLNYSDSEEHLFLGREITRTQNHSEWMSVEIDKEVKNITAVCYQEARELLTANLDTLRRLGEALLRYEVLDEEEVQAVIAGEDLSLRKAPPSSASSSSSAAPSSPGSPSSSGSPPASGASARRGKVLLAK